MVLVNERDEERGLMEKMEAHRRGVLHRAFSVFIFNAKGEMLLQQRAATKYHGGLLWTNACCSHPHPGEAVADAARRRLEEELGFTTNLQPVFTFTYRAEVENGLVEYEYDHVFAGEYRGRVLPNADEVADTCHCSMKEIEAWLLNEPHAFTAWFRIAFPRVQAWWRETYAAAAETGEAGASVANFVT